jgi:sulfur-carrier protein
VGIRVKIPTLLRGHVGGQLQVEGDGATIRDVLADLESKYPGMTATLLADDGRLNRFVNVYLNDEDVRYLGALETEVRDGDTVAILPAVAGGGA